MRVAAAILLLCLLAPALAAQAGASSDTEKALEKRLDELEKEIKLLRSRLERQEKAARKTAQDEALPAPPALSVYGDIGLRWHWLFESKTETISRPEFRVHLGVYGTPWDTKGHRLRYDLRLTSSAADDNGKPTPTLSWLPFPGYGVDPILAADRFLIEYGFEGVVFATAGKFPAPWAGTGLVFDDDYNLQGIAETVRFDRMFSDSLRRWLPRVEAISVQSYLAQNNIGLPAPVAETQPVYVGAQLLIDTVPFESSPRMEDGAIVPGSTSEFELRTAFGVHWFDGEEGIAPNLGTGYLTNTTNVLNDDGLILSEFLLFEFYAEVVVFRSRRMRLRPFFHGVWNAHADSRPGSSERNDQAFVTGLIWGMEQLREQWDFRLRFRYFHIEADAVIPEFNDEALNTNIKGWELSLALQVFSPLTLYGDFMLSEREDYELPGFGRPGESDPNRASGQSFRIRAGLYLTF